MMTALMKATLRMSLNVTLCERICKLWKTLNTDVVGGPSNSRTSRELKQILW